MVCHFGNAQVLFRHSLHTDEKWLDWLDGRIALLIDRSSVDPREYGGKDEEEYVSKQHSTESR